MARIGSALAALTLLAVAACGGRSQDPAGVPTPAPAPAPAPAPSPPPAPWSASSLENAPDIYLREWRDAENRETCAPLAFAPAAVEPGAEPRAATFSGGWAVAYDLPGRRSAFGIAGTGVEPGPDTYDAWPHRLQWADGSSAGYGPEGGSGPRQLAYLRVSGERCLYNVWSQLGRAHLERLLGSLRRVAGATP